MGRCFEGSVGTPLGSHPDGSWFLPLSPGSALSCPLVKKGLVLSFSLFGGQSAQLTSLPIGQQRWSCQEGWSSMVKVTLRNRTNRTNRLFNFPFTEAQETPSLSGSTSCMWSRKQPWRSPFLALTWDPSRIQCPVPRSPWQVVTSWALLLPHSSPCS